MAGILDEISERAKRVDAGQVAPKGKRPPPGPSPAGPAAQPAAAPPPAPGAKAPLPPELVTRKAELEDKIKETMAKAGGSKTPASLGNVVRAIEANQVRRGAEPLSPEERDVASASIELAVIEAAPQLYNKAPGLSALFCLLVIFGGREYKLQQEGGKRGGLPPVNPGAGT